MKVLDKGSKHPGSSQRFQMKVATKNNQKKMRVLTKVDLFEQAVGVSVQGVLKFQ